MFCSDAYKINEVALKIGEKKMVNREIATIALRVGVVCAVPKSSMISCIKSSLLVTEIQLLSFSPLVVIITNL